MVTTDVTYRYFILPVEILTDFVLCELKAEVEESFKIESVLSL